MCFLAKNALKAIYLLHKKNSNGPLNELNYFVECVLMISKKHTFKV